MTERVSKGVDKAFMSGQSLYAEAEMLVHQAVDETVHSTADTAVQEMIDAVMRKLAEHAAFAIGGTAVAGAFYYGYRLQHLAAEAERIKTDSADIEKRIETMGIVLPPPKPPGGNYIPVKVVDLNSEFYTLLPATARQLVCFSGHVPWTQKKDFDGVAKSVADGQYEYVGKVGAELGVAEGQAAARLCISQILAQLKDTCGGELGRVERVVRLGVHVNCSPDFADHPKVANGASDVLLALFGRKKGAHVRLAVGASSLPRGVCVEVEAMVEILKPPPA